MQHHRPLNTFVRVHVTPSQMNFRVTLGHATELVYVERLIELLLNERDKQKMPQRTTQFVTF